MPQAAGPSDPISSNVLRDGRKVGTRAQEEAQLELEERGLFLARKQDRHVAGWPHAPLQCHYEWVRRLCREAHQGQRLYFQCLW